MLSAVCASFTSPGDPVPHIRQALAKYYHNYPQEKVYLRFDKQSYLSGETIWFSGYLTYQSIPSVISNVLYVELFNEKGFVINRSMLQVENGAVSGDFMLPVGLHAGNYYIRAYTAWMLNFNSTLFFYQKISVTDKGKPAKEKSLTGHADFAVQFFPESGNLVSRLTSMVVFKAVDTSGQPVAVSGKVFNNLGDTIALMKTVHDGMGSFVLHCTPQTVYTALVTANGISKKIQLPAVQTSGIVLHTETKNNNSSDSIFFHIARTGVNKEQFENLVLCAQMENHFSVTKIHFNESTVNDAMDTILTAPYPLLLNNFSSGVLHLSVLNEAGTILSDRLLFLHAGKINSELKATMDNDANGKNNFVISVPDDYKGMLSVSVTDADKVIDSGSRAGIQSGILLASGINTIVHGAEWYLDETNPEAAAMLDALLVTCKPARIDVQKILSGDDPLVKYVPEKSITLKGRAFEVNGSKKTPLINGALFLILKSLTDSLTKPLSVSTDSIGSFVVHGLSFHDTANVYVQTGTRLQGQTTNNIAIEFSKEIIDSISGNSFVLAPAVLNSRLFNKSTDSIAKETTMIKQAGMLKNVTVTARAKTHIDSVLALYATGIFANPGVWAQTIDLTNDPIMQMMDEDVLNWLNGKVAGLEYSFVHGMPLISWRYSNVIAGLSADEQIKLNAPSFFLNEALLNAGPEGYDGAMEILMGVRMADVALIRVFKPGTMPNVPDNGPHGSIAIYLKNGKELVKRSAKINFEQSSKYGFKKDRNFADVSGSKSNATLYWNPALKTDPVTHTVTFSFNNNGAKHLRIIVEGLDENGKMVRLNQLVQ